MSNGGYLVPPEKNPAHARLWNETWKRLERFLPGLKGELFPEGGASDGPSRVGEEEQQQQQLEGERQPVEEQRQSVEEQQLSVEKQQVEQR